MIWLAASVMVPSSVLTGLASFAVVTVAAHPASGRTRTPMSGVPSGRATRTVTVDALSFSLGTRNVSPDIGPAGAGLE